MSARFLLNVMILNFANCDMVGHTGVMEAAKKAVKVTDECVKKVIDTILSVGGQALLTADHGNCDYMFDPNTKAPFTAHTTNPVPFAVIGADGVKGLQDGGKLRRIARIRYAVPLRIQTDRFRFGDIVLDIFHFGASRKKSQNAGKCARQQLYHAHSLPHCTDIIHLCLPKGKFLKE